MPSGKAVERLSWAYKSPGDPLLFPWVRLGGYPRYLQLCAQSCLLEGRVANDPPGLHPSTNLPLPPQTSGDLLSQPLPGGAELPPAQSSNSGRPEGMVSSWSALEGKVALPVCSHNCRMMSIPCLPYGTFLKEVKG